MRALYGTRDDYQGKFQPPIAAPHEPVRVVSMRRSGDCVLIAINDGGNVQLIRVTSQDDPRLLTLAANNRSNAQSALTAIGREVNHAA